MRVAVARILVVVAGCSPGTSTFDDPRGFGACAHGDEMPSDRAVAACLSEERTKFATLVSMAEHDRGPSADTFALGTDRIGDCWLVYNGWDCGGLERIGMSAARYRRYIELLTFLGAYRVVERRRGTIEIDLFRAGIVTSGSGKALIYSPDEVPGPLVPDTDLNRSVHYTVNYAALGDGWYVEHDSN